MCETVGCWNLSKDYVWKEDNSLAAYIITSSVRRRKRKKTGKLLCNKLFSIRDLAYEIFKSRLSFLP